MKKKNRLTILAIVVLALLLPGLIPNVNVTNQTRTNQANLTANTTTFQVPIVDASVMISPSGEARAWNLIAVLCMMGLDDMCDLYWHGQDEGWWN